MSSKAEAIVKQRYATAAKTPEASLCCPVNYDPNYLEIIPQEIIEKDYGCGNPSRYLKRGEIVLDLGSGAGKVCFIAAQLVGAEGRVIGIDMTDEMLEIARRNAPIVAKSLGYANVEFRKGRIQDLALDLELFDQKLRKHPVTGVNSFLAAEATSNELRTTHPLVPTESIDVVISNCVLNLVSPDAKRQLFPEIFRVLKTGGRAVISDIVSDEDVPTELQSDPDLWSGCISGSLREDLFLEAFERAGFYGLRILERAEKPWRKVKGIEFRSLTLEAFKGKQGPCFERNQAIIYKGPFKEVLDDDNHRFERGKRSAVCDKTFQLYRKAPYGELFEFVEPMTEIPLVEARPFACSANALRHPKQTKGQDYQETSAASQCCDGGSCV
jgi:SAM-dependent methyltransferase